jgi:hypothetical protein
MCDVWVTAALCTVHYLATHLIQNFPDSGARNGCSDVDWAIDRSRALRIAMISVSTTGCSVRYVTSQSRIECLIETCSGWSKIPCDANRYVTLKTHCLQGGDAPAELDSQPSSVQGG